MNQIALEGMAFYAHHGYYTEERKRGNNYIVDVYIDYDMENAADSDHLSDAVNYERVYAICEEEMGKPRHLIESVAKSIATRIRAEFDHTGQIRVLLRKLKPELGGSVAQASVSYSI